MWILTKNYLRNSLIFSVDINSKLINVKLINKNNVKHCYLRIKDKNLLQITANKYFTLTDAKNLIENKKEWIDKHLNKVTKTISSDEYCYLGKIYTNKYFSKKELVEFYRKKSNEIITPLVEKNAKLMNLYPISLKYRNNKTRWGSCSYKNAINLNLNLMKLPIEAIEYVVIHELAHIKHKNHSKRFWNLVEKYCENYKECEKILKSF